MDLIRSTVDGFKQMTVEAFFPTKKDSASHSPSPHSSPSSSRKQIKPTKPKVKSGTSSGNTSGKKKQTQKETQSKSKKQTKTSSHAGTNSAESHPSREPESASSSTNHGNKGSRPPQASRFMKEVEQLSARSSNSARRSTSTKNPPARSSSTSSSTGARSRFHRASKTEKRHLSSPLPAATYLYSSSSKKKPKPKKKTKVNSRLQQQLKSLKSDNWKGRVLPNGLVALIIDGEEIVHNPETARKLIEAKLKGINPFEVVDTPETPLAPAASASASASAPKLTLADKFRDAFSLEGIEERLLANVEAIRKKNVDDIAPEIQAIADALESKEREAVRQQLEEEQQAAEEEEEEARKMEEEEKNRAAQEAVRLAKLQQVTSRGRVSRPPPAAGASLASMGTADPNLSKKSGVHWNSEEYRSKNRSQFQGGQEAQSQQVTTPVSSSITISAAVAGMSASSSFFNAAVSSIQSSDSLDPLMPDRVNDEIFKIPAKWRVQWKDPSVRMTTKLSTMPTTEFKEFKSFELPFEDFGEDMQKLQKKDVLPKFISVTKNRLAISRDEFNTSMGINKRNTGGTRGRKDDDDASEQCACQYRSAADTPKPGSKQALAESAAGKSFNCGEDCHNALTKVECNAENCNLVASGRGDQCQNRKFTNVEYFPGIEPFKTEFKGWGLRCSTTDIPAGTFLIEYVGEIINNEMCLERMAEENERVRKLNLVEMKRREEIRQKEEKKRILAEQQRIKEVFASRVSMHNPNADERSKRTRTVEPRGSSMRERKPNSRFQEEEEEEETASKKQKKSSKIAYGAAGNSDESEPVQYMEGEGPKASNFYFLTIAEDVIIDAGARGSFARFTNHSCNPNCHIEKWTVNGMIRIGIFSNQRIPKGKELTIDYKYDRVGNVHRQACFCGEKNCAKFIGGKKKELEEDRPLSPSKKKSSKSKEPTKLNDDDADEVCPMCGDGGDMLLCDSKVNGQFCTRCYHPKCVGLRAQDIPKTWICPYHFCDDCGNRPRYFCHTCSESACDRCWDASRRPDAAQRAQQVAVEKEDAPSTLHLTKIRRDMAHYNNNLWTCCSTCQLDPMCMRASERELFYQLQRVEMVQAIEERLEDDPKFGSGKSPEDLYQLMYDEQFEPSYQCNYWNVSHQVPGKWSDGFVSSAYAAKPKELTPIMKMTDQEYIQYEKNNRTGSGNKMDEDEDEEEEKKESDDEPDRSTPDSSSDPVAMEIDEPPLASAAQPAKQNNSKSKQKSAVSSKKSKSKAAAATSASISKKGKQSTSPASSKKKNSPASAQPSKKQSSKSSKQQPGKQKKLSSSSKSNKKSSASPQQPKSPAPSQTVPSSSDAPRTSSNRVIKKRKFHDDSEEDEEKGTEKPVKKASQSKKRAKQE